MKPSILVTGGGGQLARALARAASQFPAIGTVTIVGRPAFDFDRPDSIAEVIQGHPPALVVNAAAWTAVDAAEAEPAAAARANTEGPAALAQICNDNGMSFIHVSTDYVFDGLKGSPYVETDQPRPTGVYGATKLAGEVRVREIMSDAIILRTSWVYAEAGRNFVLTMLNAARRISELRVVADQVGCPTNADDLAHAVLGVASHRLAHPRSQTGGIYHAAGSGSTSWHGFAEAIFAEAEKHGWNHPRITPIATSDWPTPATRPPDSRLECTRLAGVFGVHLPAWQPSLQRAVAAICAAPPT